MTNAFFNFITTRHNIYLKKQSGEAYPWSHDPILAAYKFCNVFRELDTTTIWIRKHIRERYANHDLLWFYLSICRRINLIGSLQELLDAGVFDKWDTQKAYDVLMHRQNRGDKIYSSAYMLTCGGNKVPKLEYTLFWIAEPMFKNREIITKDLKSITTLESFCEYLNTYRGYSWFISYEVATDLRHTKTLGSCTDIHTWANPGPGAKRGLNRLHSRPLEHPTKRWQLIQEMQELLALSKTKLDYTGTFKGHKLEMRDIEHCLCEFDKYQRVLTNQGTPRQKYRPG